MKTKLLKKVRKRFSIVHYPKGYISDSNYHFDHNTFKLFDKKIDSEYFPHRERVTVNTCSFNYDKSFNTEQEAINYLKGQIIKILREEGYKQRKDNEIIKSYKKVWYVKNG
jgi:hypothetical protein